MELSDDHQLVLACCWLNLKECALATAAIVKTALKGDYMYTMYRVGY